MSAQLYSHNPYTMPTAPRRNPLSNAANTVYPQAPPKQQQEKPKQSTEPPLQRQNSKTTPPSPPRTISDKGGNVHYRRVGFLGEGGFARVYEVKDLRGVRLACKVVTKSSLKTKKAKTKLYAEIKIHRSLKHPNIVHFHDCFEDDANVYMTLELCPLGSMMDMLRHRRRFTEPESRFYMIQLLGACYFMHTHQVIHRDLKLGNLFLDANMNIKVGDFGLAALIESPGERKKTICGTPNYIAPEVLFDTVNGHSFEVDTWSIGVILYTLVVGRPPFQTKEKDVKTIYKRIRDNLYEFPTTHAISNDSQNLITQILTPDPTLRPTLHSILGHAFFIRGTVPPYIPTSAHDFIPDFSQISRSASKQNFEQLCHEAGLDNDYASEVSASVPADEVASENVRMKSVTSTIAQQEKEFQKAVQPGSPISVLLSSARQPLVMGSTTGGSSQAGQQSPLFRKLQAAQKDARAGRTGLAHIAEEGEPAVTPAEKERDLRRKELESQKARIVAQMAEDAAGEYAQERMREKERELERENVPPVLRRESEREVRGDLVAEKGKSKDAAPPAPSNKLNAFDSAAQVLTLAFDAKAAGRVFRDPRNDSRLPIPDERVFIVSWVDYCNKYGMGYALTDGSVGVHFNDSTTIVLSADKQHFDYVTARRQGTVFVRKSYTVDAFPEELKNKVYLLKHFERYIMDRLYGEYDYTFEDVDRQKGMEWVQKYLRMKHVIVFKLSHDVLQFNFYDHTKLILSSHGLLVTYIDRNYRMTRWTLADLMASSLKPSNSVSGLSAASEEAKFQARIVDKLKYCREVLVSIKTASSNSEQDAAEIAVANEMRASSGTGSHGSRSSKAS